MGRNETQYLEEIEALEALGIEPDEIVDTFFERGTLERADDYMDIYYHDLANK